MHTLPNYPGLNVLLILLSLLCYMMWDGRGMDNYGRSWIELHVVLLLSALAGAGLRVYAQLRPEARERTVGYSALLFLGLVFLGDMTAAWLLALLVGPRAVLACLESAFSLPSGVWFWFLVFVVFVTAATPDPWLVGVGIVVLLLSIAKSGEEEPRQYSGARMWAVFWGIAALFLSAYYLYGQFNNAMPLCASSEVCARYPYTFLQMRCIATCALVHNFSRDWLFNVAAAVFAMVVLRGANHVTATLQRFLAQRE